MTEQTDGPLTALLQKGVDHAQEGVATRSGPLTDGRPPVWVGHIHLPSSDVRRSSDFYEKLGFRPVAVTPGLAVLELRGGTHVVLVADPNPVPQPAGFDLMVEDLDAIHAWWSAMGVEVSPIAKGSIHRSFTVRDLDGNSIVVNNSHVVGVV